MNDQESLKFQDYYMILGVPSDASQDDIRKAYRSLARKYHPDVSKSADAEEQFKKINEANEVLHDPEKRKRYDTLGRRWEQGQEFEPPPEWTDPFFEAKRPAGDTVFTFEGEDSFSDFFSAVFGAKNFGAKVRPFPRQGHNLEVEIEVPLEDIYNGAKRSLAFETVESNRERGVARSKRSYEITIPPGIKEGSIIRLSGQGGSGAAGGQAGDLFLRVHIAPNKVYSAWGYDLHTQLKIAPWEAVLGAQPQIRLPDGKELRLEVSPSSAGGKKLRLKGRGLSKSKAARGDLLVELKIVVPEEVSAEEEELWMKLKAGSGFLPRGPA